MIDERVNILENKKVNPKYYRLIFASRRLARGVKPGQFLQIQIQPGTDPFLRRPFSYYRVRAGKVEILYEVLGRGTGILAAKQKGESLQAMGPLGKPFRQILPRGKICVLVAGGVGVPPLVFAAETRGANYLLIGTKSKAEILPRGQIKDVKAKVLYSTNDGSYGTKGFVTKLLEQVAQKESPEKLFIQTCGPTVMMKAVWDFARRQGIEGEASLEEPMACGVGACLGCMVLTPQGWVPSCTEGPVFNFNEISQWT